MKNIAAIIASTVALVAVSALAPAQQPGPASPVQVPPVLQKGKKEANKARVAKLDEQEKKAYKALSGAIKLAEHALPIYDGHRVLAVDLLKTARTDIVVGANNEAAKVKKGKKAAKANAVEGHDKSKYTPEQIAASQKSLQQAVEILNRAIEDLSGKTDTYNTEAAANIRKAQDELKAAIALHAAP